MKNHPPSGAAIHRLPVTMIIRLRPASITLD
jgi:hypothetical protein